MKGSVLGWRKRTMKDGEKESGCAKNKNKAFIKAWATVAENLLVNLVNCTRVGPVN